MGWSKWNALWVLPIAYVLSSGPILGLAFWLRETLHDDRFYAAMWLYYPLFILGHDNLIGSYIAWWVVNVFHTVGPG